MWWIPGLDKIWLFLPSLSILFGPKPAFWPFDAFDLWPPKSIELQDEWRCIFDGNSIKIEVCNDLSHPVHKQLDQLTNTGENLKKVKFPSCQSWKHEHISSHIFFFLPDESLKVLQGGALEHTWVHMFAADVKGPKLLLVPLQQTMLIHPTSDNSVKNKRLFVSWVTLETHF